MAPANNTPPDPLLAWLDAIPELPGMRSLDRLAAAPDRARPQPRYRRQLPPGEAASKPVPHEIFSLVREAGVLRWRPGAVVAGAARPRAGARAGLPAGQVVRQYAFEQLPTSQVYKALTDLDLWLTPAAFGGGSGLRRLRNGRLEPFADAGKAAGKKLLLIIHGTFSKSEAVIVDGLQSFADGARLLADAEKRYELVLAFDHPTLGVSPMLNAFDLAARLRPAPSEIDIVCHSRGGLVARWFCEAFADAATRRRVVFVGSPLAGTSLAAAPKLKNALDLLTNVADALQGLGDRSSADALFGAAGGLVRVLGSVTGAVLNTAVLDAAIALVPGLDAQSRLGNNPELLRLHANTGSGDFKTGQIRYFAIASDFQPQAIGWNFLRLFSKPMARVADWAADRVFDAANDLVVDTSSMKLTADNHPIVMAHDFGTNDRVHHLNYFRQSETVTALRKSLAIPAA